MNVINITIDKSYKHITPSLERWGFLFIVIFIIMNKEDLLEIMEYYLFDQIVKKRTSVNGITYFFVKDNSFEDGEMYVVYAYYTENNKTLHLYPYWFANNEKVQSFPTYEMGYEPSSAKVEGFYILDLTTDWFKDKFPELDIREVELMDDYLFHMEIMDGFDEDYVDIGSSDISEDIKRIKKLLK